MYSDEFQLGSAQLELGVYIQDDEQTRNKQKETTGRLCNPCLRNRNLVLQSSCQGNRKELSYLMPIGAVTHESNFNRRTKENN